MFVYDVLNKEKVWQIVSNDLRNLGVKRRVKKQPSSNKPAQQQPSEKSDKKKPPEPPHNLKKVFKTPLSQLPLDVVKLSSGAIIHVPSFLTQACTCVEKCATHEGIFRKAGSHLRQKEIMSRLDAGASLGDKYQVVDVANVLKTFFRELPEPLIPISYHDVFLRCALLKSSRVQALLLACILLPPHHLNTLAFFAEFLKRVAKHEKMNKMGIDNLAKVVGPNLMPIQETTMSAIQSRLETQLVIIKILIENAERIGVLPEHVADFLNAENSGSVETELDASDSCSRGGKNKKKKRRSGSLTRKTHLSASNLNLRMLNGLKKMVSKGGSPDESSAPNNRVVSLDFNPAHTPSIKTGKKRKVAEPTAPLSAKKKREVLQTMPDGGFTRQGNILASLVSNDPNPCKEKSPVQKSRVKKYLSQKIHNDISANDKLEKTKKIRLSLDRLVSKSKQKLADLDSNSHEKASNSPKIERRWSSVSGSSWSKKKRGVYETLVNQSPLKSKNNDFQDAYEQEEVFMEADVNLSDENEPGDERIIEERMEIDGNIISEVTKRDPEFKSTFSRRYEGALLPYDLLNRTKDQNPGSKFLQINIATDQGDEEYVTIPKSEYEEIKNRVSAIESRISQEFGSISTNVSQNIVTQSSAASNVQSEYEKTLEEASIGNTTTADHLAKRLGKELKIRRSAEHKIIRSPSARKIGNLRRRSQERPVGKQRGSRHVSWLVSKQDQLDISAQKSGLKRGRPNTVFTGLTQPNSQESTSNSDTICSDETNARLDFLQKQLHALITHTVEHTKGSLSDEEVFLTDRDEDIEASELNTRSGVRRASSFHGSEFIDNSRHFNMKMRELKKSNSQQDVTLNNERRNNPKDFNVGDKNVKWKDADCYFSSDYGNRTPAQQTGRASVAKLRTQNAGMVLAKAKLFDTSSRPDSNCRLNSNRRESSKLGISRDGKSLDLDISDGKRASTPRRKHSKSPKNSGNAKLKLLHSPSPSPLIKMELTIMPSQREKLKENYVDKRGGGRQRTDYLNKDNVKIERNYKENKNSIFNSMDIEKTTRSPESINRNILSMDTNTPCKTPHIKRPLTLKTPKDGRNLIRKQGVDCKRTPMKAVALNSTIINTPRRQSPRSALKSRQLTRSVS